MCTSEELQSKYIGAIINFRYKAGEVPLSIINSIQDALNGEEVGWPLIFLQQFHFELERIKMELQEPGPIITNTRIGIHLTFILPKLRILTAYHLHSIHVTKKTRERELLSSFPQNTLQCLDRLVVTMNTPSSSDEQDTLAASMEINIVSDSDITINTSQELRKSEKTKTSRPFQLLMMLLNNQEQTNC